MEENLISYGLVMVIETVIIMVLVADLIYRAEWKRKKISHPHVLWNAGAIFLGYLICVFVFNTLDLYSIYKFYLISNEALSKDIVTTRVVGKSFLMLAKILLWVGTARGNFQLFKIKI